jgi:2-phospho-L-lactate guanylyltransferase
MSLWAILPVKPLKQGKTRLSGVLSDDERYVLNMTMLGNTLNAMRQAKRIDQIVVVSRDPGVLSVSRNFGARTFQEESTSNLNRAVTLGVRFAMAGLADAVLIMPADLPLLETKYIQDVTDHMDDGNQMIIVPDRRDDGTNGLLLNPPDAIDFQFGAGSFQRHIQQAQHQGLKSEIVRIPALGLDLDVPVYLDVLRAFLFTQTLCHKRRSR